MKTLVMAKPLAIIVIGLPGSGKSFFARQFADTFNAPIISFDRIRYELFNQPTYAKDEEAIVGRIAIYMLHEILKAQKTFIIDGGHNVRNDRYELSRALKRRGYDVLLCWVQTDLTTCKQRALRRNQQRSSDAFNVSLTPALFEDMTRRFSPPAVSEKFVVISGKHTYATQARTLLRRLAGYSSPVEDSSATGQSRNNEAASRPMRRINVVTHEQKPLPQAPPRRNININQ